MRRLRLTEMKRRVQNRMMRSLRVQKWTQAVWPQTSIAGRKDRLWAPGAGGRETCRRWRGCHWSRCCSGAKEAGTSRWRCWWKVALRGQLLAAIVWDPSTRLMEAPDAWGERERSKMERDLVWELRVHFGEIHWKSTDAFQWWWWWVSHSVLFDPLWPQGL